MEEYDLYPEDIYNIDKKRFIQGVIIKERVIILRD